MHLTMTPAQRDRAIQGLELTIRVMREAPVRTACPECDHFDQLSGECNRWGQIVPADARAAGCAEWREGVPF